MQKNRSIKPKIRWKAKKSPDVWQGQHQALEVQQALIHLVYDLNPGNFIIPGVFYRLTAVRSV